MKVAIVKFLSGLPLGVSNIARGASGELAGWNENDCQLSVDRNVTAKSVVLKLISGSVTATEILQFDANDRYVGSIGENIPTELTPELQSAGVLGTKFPGAGGGGGGSSTYAGLTDAASVALPSVNAPLATALAGKIAASEKAAAYGVATLDANGKLPASQVPDIALVQYLGSVNSQANMLLLTGQQGDWCTRSDVGANFVLTASPASILSNWVQMLGSVSAVSSVAGRTGAVSLTKSDVGLSAVDNTADADKPVSTAQAAAIAGKASILADVTISAAGAVALTKALHNGRRIIVAAAGVSFTSQASDWTGTDVAGCSIDLQSGDYTLTASAGLVIPAGTATGSATALAGSLDLTCVGGVLKCVTPSTAGSVIPPTRNYTPSTFTALPVSTNGGAAVVSIPAGVFGPKSLAKVVGCWEQTGTTDNLSYAVHVGAAGSTWAGVSANQAGFAVMTAANGAQPFEFWIRGNLVDQTSIKALVSNSGTPTNAAVAASMKTFSINTASAWEVHFGATTGATDTASLAFALVEIINPVA